MSFLRLLRAVFTAVVGFIFNAFTHYDQVVNDIADIVSTWRALDSNVRREIDQIRNFEFNPAWRTKVISVPAAVTHIQDLKTILLEDFRSRIDTLVQPVHDLTLILRQEAAPDPEDPQRAISAMSRAEVKLGEIATMIHSLAAAMHEVSDIVGLFTELRENVAGLDAVFLQQGNARRYIHATDGEVLKLRVGNLHEP